MDPTVDQHLDSEAHSCVAEIRERVALGRARLEDGLAETTDAVAQLVRTSESGATGAPEELREATALEAQLQQHDRLLDAFVRAVAKTTESQVILERRAHAHTSEVHTISRAMARAASSSRLVAINALINANALESGQATLAALAQEMQQLSGVVQVASADVDAVANRLGEILPALNERVSRIAAATERFAIEVGTERALVRRAVGDLDQALDDARRTAASDPDRFRAVDDALDFRAVVVRSLDTLADVADRIEEATRTPEGTEAARPNLVAC